MIHAEYTIKINIKFERVYGRMEKVLINLQLFLLIITGILRDANNETEYIEKEIYVLRKTIIAYFIDITIIKLKEKINIIYYEYNKYFKMKISSEGFSDVNYIECMRC